MPIEPPVENGAEYVYDPGFPCQHRFVAGPFFVKTATSREEPEYYPPSGLVQVEHCILCGQLRLPRSFWQQIGPQLAVAHEAPQVQGQVLHFNSNPDMSLHLSTVSGGVDVHTQLRLPGSGVIV